MRFLDLVHLKIVVPSLPCWEDPSSKD